MVFFWIGCCSAYNGKLRNSIRLSLTLFDGHKTVIEFHTMDERSRDVTG